MAAEGERVRQETLQQVNKVRANAEQEIVSAGKAARHELKAYAAELSVKIAEEKVRSRMTPDADGRLVDSFLKGIN